MPLLASLRASKGEIASALCLLDGGARERRILRLEGRLLFSQDENKYLVMPRNVVLDFVKGRPCAYCCAYQES